MERKNNNIFVRTLVVCLVIFILFIITYSFLSIQPKGSISTGIITLILLLVIITLSESFDNFSISKLFTMSRDIKSKEDSIQKLNTENTELRKEFVNVVTSISQNQSSTNIIGLPSELAKNMGIEKATEDEVSNKRSEENEESSNGNLNVRIRIDNQKVEEIAISKFLLKNNLSELNLIKEAKLVTKFSGIDEISNVHPIYDAYIHNDESEIFIEVKLIRRNNITFLLRDRFYLMLNKIYLYNKIKKANAHLKIIFVPINTTDSDGNSSIQRSLDRLKEFFEPAIVKGILKIDVIELNEDEMEQVLINS